MFLLPLNTLAYSIIDYSFITKYEYGQMLFENPRGIGCVKCHGQKAQGSLIAQYKDRKGDIKQIVAPQIKGISWEKFQKVLSAKENKSLVMPTYFLTKEELVSIHFYLNNLKEDE
jgi:hypothetical protein